MASPTNKKLVDDLLFLYKDLLLPFMEVRRDIPFPTEPFRNETDGEHAFTLAMICLTLHEKLDLKLDRGLIAEYALVHDLVEAYAGDVSVLAPESEHQKKETAERKALGKITELFESIAPWVPKRISDYENRKDNEARFVYVVDKCAGALNWLSSNGTNWLRNYPDQKGKEYYGAVKRLREKAVQFPDLLDLFDDLHNQLDQKRETYQDVRQSMPRPGVGVGILVRRKDKVLLAKRQGSHGSGFWAPPGGHLEFKETFQECASRELKEETGLDITNFEYLTTTNDYFPDEGKHYVTIWLEGVSERGIPRIIEPEKCTELKWFDKEEIPEKLFIPFYNLIRKKGFKL